MKKHYLVYQITNLINNKIYIGIHGTDDIEDGYMGSGTRLKRAIKKYGIENFIKEILFNFDNPDEMILKESELVDRKFIARKDVYNIKIGGEGWLTFDSVTVKDKDGCFFRVHKNDNRLLNGDLLPVTTGFVPVKDSNGETFQVSKDDPRYLSGELKHNYTGLLTVQDINGNFYCVSKDDYRVKSGELFHKSKGKVVVKDNNDVIFQVSKDDPRFLSGELIHIWKGRMHKEETKKKIGEKNSKAQRGEGNSQFGTCWIFNNEIKQNKKINKTDIDIWIDSGWTLGRRMNF